MRTVAGRQTVSLIIVAGVVGATALDAQALPARDPAFDSAHPPAQAELTIPSHGSTMNGFLYVAAGAGPHATVVFLHGNPGNERNLDLAQAVRRAGYNALYFDYRGSWGSGGSFSLQNALDDVGAAIAFLRAPTTSAKYHVDTGRIMVVGHSMGGWIALMSAARNPAISCVVALAASNRGQEGERMRAHPEEHAARVIEFRRTTNPESGPIRARAEDLVDEMEVHAADYDLLSHISELKDRHILLVAGTRDTSHEIVRDTLARALAATGAAHVRSRVYDDDHALSAHRLALAALLVDWLGRECPRTRP